MGCGDSLLLHHHRHYHVDIAIYLLVRLSLEALSELQLLSAINHPEATFSTRSYRHRHR